MFFKNYTASNITDNKHKLLKLIKWMPIANIISISAILILISIYGINKYFHKKIQELERNSKKEMILSSINNINTIKDLTSDINLVIKDSFKREIRTEIDSVMILINDIYFDHITYPKDKIVARIKEELRGIRFFDNKSGYYFIYDKHGKVILLPIKPSLEGKNLWNYKDIKGKYIIRDFVYKLKNHPHGIFEEWYYYRPGTNIIEKKLGYISYYKPLNLIVGTAVYYNSIKNEMRKRFLQIVSKMGKTSYSSISILDQNAKVLYTKDLNMINHNLDKKMVELAKSDKNKIHIYKSKDKSLKVISYYKPLNLTIVSDIDLNKINTMTKNNKKELKNIVHQTLSQFLLTAIAFVLISMFLSLYFSKNVEKIFLDHEKSLIKAKDIAQENTKAKSEFLANMSHEIRTPLNAMIGFIKILKDKDFSDEDKGYLNIIEKSGQNLLAIINDILDFSKIEAGKFHIEYTSFNPRENVDVIYGLFSTCASKKDILLKINVENLNYHIISDSTRIKQVVSNLLSNAIKFSQNGKKIELNIKYDDIGQKLFVEVVDEGIGIPENKLSCIFQAFTQSDNSTTRKYGGTGLGLSISYRIIELLGGELKVKSTLGKGSKFYFEIPAEKGSPILESEQKKEKLTKNIKFGYHILLVEDNGTNQMFMKVLLKKLGNSFDIASNGKEAIEKFKNNSYDVILMDENMPLMNGIEATKIIRKIEKVKGITKQTIIIALTANALEGDRERFLEAGMDMYLAKPLDIKKLVAVLSKIKAQRSF